MLQGALRMKEKADGEIPFVLKMRYIKQTFLVTERGT